MFQSVHRLLGPGSRFVFSNLSHLEHLAKVCGAPDFLFPFVFKALPPILFVSAFFTMLYHYGIVQKCVRVLARVMVYLMQTSGAETLSVSANVFMGQTEAPLIVRPYVPRMTNSELFALMTSGFAHISGAMMFVYINYGADPTAVLATCVMACPCSLYLAKLYLPETGSPETAGRLEPHAEKSRYVNGIDAIAAGTSDGLRLALNVAAMLIVFIAFVAMADALLGAIKPVLSWLGAPEQLLRTWPDDLSLSRVLGWLFSPVAFLIGVEPADVETVGSLLGSKLSVNEHYAYLQFKSLKDANPAFHTRTADSDGLRPHGICQLRFGGGPARRDRRDCPGTARGPRPPGRSGPLRRLCRHAPQRGDCGGADVSLFCLNQSRLPLVSNSIT